VFFQIQGVLRLLAESPVTLDSIITIGTSAGFGAMAWYFVAKVMPDKDREHRQERNADQEQWLKERAALDSKYKEEREQNQSRWREERAELLSYISTRDANWLGHVERMTDVIIRVEALLLKTGKDNGN
jgi:hypothetical protein